MKKVCKICKKKLPKNKQFYCSPKCAITIHHKQNKITWAKRYYPNKYSEHYKKYYQNNPKIYLKVLKHQAISNKKSGKDDFRRDEIMAILKKNQSINKGLPPKRWEAPEIEYLEENYREKLVKEMAVYLNRSWISVTHKLSRLGLIYYNKWN